MLTLVPLASSLHVVVAGRIWCFPRKAKTEARWLPWPALTLDPVLTMASPGGIDRSCWTCRPAIRTEGWTRKDSLSASGISQVGVPGGRQVRARLSRGALCVRRLRTQAEAKSLKVFLNSKWEFLGGSLGFAIILTCVVGRGWWGRLDAGRVRGDGGRTDRSGSGHLYYHWPAASWHYFRVIDLPLPSLAPSDGGHQQQWGWKQTADHCPVTS